MPAEAAAMPSPGALPEPWIDPGDALPGAVARMSTRAGGVGSGRFATMNLRCPTAAPPRDDVEAVVAQNRARFAAALAAPPVWLHQVHGARVVDVGPADAAPGAPVHEADAAITTATGVACTVMVADCLPVLFSAARGRAVGAAHAGWRGLAAGVLEATVDALCTAAGCRAADVQAWVGPGIGPEAFEVGAEVLLAFGADPAAPSPRFRARPRPDGSARWRADLAGLAADRLIALGIGGVAIHGACTVEQASRFFSFRRDGAGGPTGRMAAGIRRAG
jgi:YfiH family protein